MSVDPMSASMSVDPMSASMSVDPSMSVMTEQKNGGDDQDRTEERR